MSVLEQLPKSSRVLNVGRNLAAWVPECPARLLRQLYDDGAVLGVMAEECMPAAHRFGFFTYKCDDYDEGPYDRVAVPRRPTSLDELPEKARVICQRVQLDRVVFADANKIQPSEHVPCFGWGTESSDEVGSDPNDAN